MPTMKNRNYGSPMGTDEPINNDRPVAGEANDTTRSKALKQRLSEKQTSSLDPAASATTPTASSVRPDHPDTDINTFSPIDNIRKGNKRIDDAIEDDSK